MGQFSKAWEDLNFSDNFIFCKVMQDKEICKEMLEILLNIRIEKINYLQAENPIENFYDSRGIRLDVYVKDSKRIFDLEIQTGNYDDLILRSRYYLSASDVATTKRRTKFKNLKETYIIFICRDDPFGCNIPRYTKHSNFLETDILKYNDKTHNVFYNCSAWKQEKDVKVREVLKFIYELKADSKFTQKLETATDYAKANSIFKDEYMYLEDVIEEEKELAREEGLAEGLAEGKAKGLAEGLAEGKAEGLAEGIATTKKETALNLIKLRTISLEDISKAIGLPLNQIKELADQL